METEFDSQKRLQISKGLNVTETEFYKKLEEYCGGKDFELSDHAEKIVKMILKRGGNCPCSVEDMKCPCPNHLKEIEEMGHCHCTLFIKN